MNGETQTILLRHERTETEHLFQVFLLPLLRRVDFVGEVHLRPFIVNQAGHPTRPGFYLPSYGLAIEIDSLARSSWREKFGGVPLKGRNSDNVYRDNIYISLGARPPLIIQGTDVVSHHKMARFQNEFLNLLNTGKISKKEQVAINKRIFDGRKKYEQQNPGIFDNNCWHDHLKQFAAFC